jgi:hypothetical protein
MRIAGEKQTLSPLSPLRGEGMGVRGQRTLAVALSTPPGQCGSSVVVEYPWCVWEGRFTPHPRPLSPGRGEGSWLRVQGEKQTLPPLPFEGRGDGGEGSKNPASPSSTPPGQCGSSVVVDYPWCVWEGRFTPHPRPLSPEGERGAGCGLRAKSRLFPLSPLRGEGMGVRGQRTLPAPCQRLRGSVDPASLWSIRGACGRGVLPLTPDPSPLRRGEGSWMRVAGRKADAFPLSPLRGEGMGVRGQRTLAAASSTPPGQCGSSVVVEYPWCVWEGRFTPHPRPLSPSRGEGSWMRVQGEKQTLSPLPFEGRGAGGEGSKNRGSALLTLPGQCGSSVVVEYPWCVWEGRFTPHPDPSPLKGRGELAADCGRKADAFTPLPFEGRGDGGEGSKNPGSASSTPPGQCGSSVVVEYPWCVWEGRFTPHPRPLSP